MGSEHNNMANKYCTSILYIFCTLLLRQCYCSKNTNVLYYCVVELLNDEIRRNDTLYPCTFLGDYTFPLIRTAQINYVNNIR